MRFAICTSAYPEEFAFVRDFFAGVEHAARGYPGTELIVAVEHGFNEFDVLAREHAKQLLVRADRAPAPTAAPALRRRMLDAAATSAADILVFADFDDRLEPDALGLHAQALAQAEISYGDMRLADVGGTLLDRNFFDGAGIPEAVAGPGPIVERNFIGFGNSAVRRTALVRARLAVPDDAMPADWWLFTLLLASGLTARRTAAPVAMYRSHPNSILGASPSTTEAMLRRRAAMAVDHYRRLAGRVELVETQHAVEHLIEFIDGDDRAWATLGPALKGCPGIWFEDVARASRIVASIMTRSHRPCSN